MSPLYKNIILASASPQRKELLAQIIPQDDFMVIASDVSEEILPGEDAESHTIRLAEEKARDVIARKKIGGRSLVIGADTIVSLDNEIIGQPKDNADAKRILKKLSRRCHTVITGVAIILTEENRIIKFAVKSKVWFKELSREMIEEYINSGEHIGKAGACCIQGLGKNLVERYEGSFTNIVGFPVEEIREALLNFVKGTVKTHTI
ncbi:septum formation protein Maf [bacterium]|nr:septum formation protein Maf [bacterium]